MNKTTEPTLQQALANDSLLFKSIFVISFVVFLAVALTGQLLFLQWRSWLPGADGNQSLINDVTSGVYTFMSHLT